MSLARKALKGFFWAAFERFGVQSISFVIFVVLARLLTPEQFGLIGMLTVFIAISRSLTDSGFSQALIQKKDADRTDYSTVFYTNLGLSSIIYGLLYISAPLISAFYGEPTLTPLVRVLGVKFVIDSFSMIQVTALTKKIDFKGLMVAKLPSTLIGGTAGIGAAYYGAGVWSLIIHQLVDSFAYSLQVWIQSGWRPTLGYDLGRLRKLFRFGSRMMVSGLINTIFNNLYLVAIGRFFSAAQVGFYDQANKIRKLPVQNLSSALERVSFPVLSEIQDDDRRLRRAYRIIIRKALFFMAPIMLGALVSAEPLFRVLLTEKWLPAVPYFQWLCVASVFHPLNSYNLNILKVKGRSDLFLRLEIIKRLIEVMGIAIAINYSVLVLVIVQTVFSLIALMLNSYYSGKFVDYTLADQLGDIWRIMASAVVTALGITYLNMQLDGLADLATIGIDITGFATVYLLLILLLDREVLTQIITMAKNYREER